MASGFKGVENLFPKNLQSSSIFRSSVLINFPPDFTYFQVLDQLIQSIWLQNRIHATFGQHLYCHVPCLDYMGYQGRPQVVGQVCFRNGYIPTVSIASIKEVILNLSFRYVKLQKALFGIKLKIYL